MLEELSIELKALLQSALALHKENRWAEAQALYQQALALSPKQPKTLQLFTLLARQTAQWPLACQLLETTLEANPLSADLHYDLGLVQSELAQLDQSIASFLRAAELQPLFPEAYYNLGNAYYASGDREKAALFYGKAAQQNPLLAEAHYNLGLLAQDRTDYDSAISCYRQALACRPDYSEAWLNLGLAYKQLGQLVPSAESFFKALELRPDYLEAWLNLAMVQQQQHFAVQAEESLRRALELQPDNVPALLNYAMLLENLGRLDEALHLAQSAVRLAPFHSPSLTSLGSLLKKRGRAKEAIEMLERAIKADTQNVLARIDLAELFVSSNRFDETTALCKDILSIDSENYPAHMFLGLSCYRQRQPKEALRWFKTASELQSDNADALLNLSFCELTLSDFSTGWIHYESRWRSKLMLNPPRSFQQAHWQGELAKDRTLLLYVEQGFGDTIQFVRYARLAAERCGRVILECQPSLKTLLRNTPGISEVIGYGEALPAFDLQLPLLSLPGLFKTILETIPGQTPYLWPSPCEMESKLPIVGKSLKVGLVWSGSGVQASDPRPIPFQELLPLFDLEGVHFYSLQTGLHSEDLRQHPKISQRIHDLSSGLTDFQATAAAVCKLDLIISIDTAVAHLAGALGRPVWTLLCFAPDWRWMLDREDSPWYPTMRLFRQEAFGNWKSVIERVRQELGRATTSLLEPLPKRRDI